MNDPTKILIVDDRPENLYAMNDLLKHEEAEIYTAKSGNEALALMLRHEFAVVLLDVMMPEMDGFETAELIRSNDDTKDTPIIFLTAINKEDSHIFRGYASGAVDYIFKPFEPDILKSKVRVFIKLYRMMIERQLLEQEVQKSKSLAQLGILAGGISHDFNNLLAAILGHLELAMDDEYNQTVLKHLNLVKFASLKARDLTRQLITFSQGGSPRRIAMSISDLVRSAVENTLVGSGVSCFFDLPDDLPQVEIDDNQIEQVLYNLVANSLEAMINDGEIVVRAEVVDDPLELPRELNEGAYVRISVEDQGVGIGEDIIDQVFDPYFSTKERGAQKGMGLGLSIVYSIIRKHNGHILAKSKEDQGTAMIFYLPVHEG